VVSAGVQAIRSDGQKEQKKTVCRVVTSWVNMGRGGGNGDGMIPWQCFSHAGCTIRRTDLDDAATSRF
jgi:hypothetical protein